MCANCAKIDLYLITISLASARLSLSNVIKQAIINKFSENPEGVVTSHTLAAFPNCWKVSLPVLRSLLSEIKYFVEKEILVSISVS